MAFFSVEHIAMLIMLTPLAGALGAGLFGKKLGVAGAHRLTIIGVTIAFFAACFLGYDFLILRQTPINQNIYTWVASGQSVFHVGVLVDTLSVMMAICVTFVSLFVHIYSIGYMQGDPGYQRFFCYVSLFTFAMLTLVLANNGLQLFFGWEGVGVVSYLLIGFWFKKPSAADGGMKAFIVNRFGDLGFLLGLAGCLAIAGSLQYTDIFASSKLMATTYWGHWRVVDLVCWGLFIGAMGKSAQIPLHVWLPESMEGPTPISALIHAATMVTAGVYMVVRMSPLFQLSPWVLNWILFMGASGAFFLGCVALVQTDIKRVVAYSTLSQLGYMMAGAGASAYSAALFHLLTHACFKALLFLGAGSVIIAMHHEQDMRQMGGLKEKMPVTYWTCLVGSLALIALPPFSGFYSKDAIITAVAMAQLPFAHFSWILLVLGTFVTALYTFRAFFLTFHGEYRGTHQPYEKIHESPKSVCVPLIVLAVPSVFLGMWLAKPLLSVQHNLLTQVMAHAPVIHHILVELGHEYSQPLSLYLGALHHWPFWLTSLGLLVAYLMYIRFTDWPSKCQEKLPWCYQILVKKYGFDAFYQRFIVNTYQCIARFCFRVFDQALIDQLLVHGAGRVMTFLGRSIRRTQTGFLYDYALSMILGVLALLVMMTFKF